MTETVSVPPVTPIRCSEAEREEVIERLRSALAEGRLEMAEFEERAAAVYAAKHHHDLDALVGDLPPAAPAAITGWRHVLSLMWRQIREDLGGVAGRRGVGWTRRRLVTAALLLLLVFGVSAVLVDGFAFDHGHGEHGGHHGPASMNGWAPR